MKTVLKPRTLLSVLALAGALATPQLANAQTACAAWDVSQGWYAIQGSHNVSFQLRQQRTQLEGAAAYYRPGETTWGKGIAFFIPMQSFGGQVEGRVTGSVDGDSIELETAWGGVYVGTIDATGRIDGYTYDKRNSTSSARWYSDRRMNCLARAGAPAAPPPAAMQPLPVPVPVPNRESSMLMPMRGSMAASVFAGAPRPAPAPAAPAAPAPAPTPAPAVSPLPTNLFGLSCKHGFVRRSARATDLVCVTPDSRARVATENLTRAKRVQPGGGFYGPNTCRVGFVWREAYVGDLVCVTPAVRAFVRQENQLAATRVNPMRKS